MALTGRVFHSCMVGADSCLKPLHCRVKPSFSSSLRPRTVASSQLKVSYGCCALGKKGGVSDWERFLGGGRLQSSSVAAVTAAGKRRMSSFNLQVSARRGFLRELESIRDENNVAGPLEFESPLQVILYPDPRLRAKNKRINVFDESLQKFIKELLDAMYRTDGVGLSAPQVGVNVRVMVYNPVGERGKGKEYVLVNPKITKYSASTDVDEEGCLSFPGLGADVVRPLGVKVDAQDEKGRKFSFSLKGWQARIFQHEYDHLEGVLFHDRMSPVEVQKITPLLRDLEELYATTYGVEPPERVGAEKSAQAGKA